MASANLHKKQIIVNNDLDGGTKSFKLKLGKGDWNKRLQNLNKKINKKWKVEQYSFSIKRDNNSISFEKNDVQKFQAVLSTTLAPVTISIVSSASAANTGNDEKKHYTLIFEHKTKKFKYIMRKDSATNDAELFNNIIKAIKNHYKFYENIAIYDLDDCELMDLDDIQSALDDCDGAACHLKVVIDTNPVDDYKRQYPDLGSSAKPKQVPVIKLMKNCQNHKVETMVQYHTNIMTKITQNYRSDINKTQIKSDDFYHVLEALNVARPRMQNDYYELSKAFKEIIQFWQRYAQICLIQHNVEQCIKARVVIDAVLFESDAFQRSEAFQKEYTNILRIIEQYHKLYENAGKSAFDVLLRSIKSIKIEVKQEQRPTDPGTLLDDDDFVLANQQDIQQAQRKKAQKYRIYLYFDQLTKAAHVQFTDISKGFYAMNAVAKNPNLWYIDADPPWLQNQNYTKIMFAYEGLLRNKIMINTQKKLYKGSFGFFCFKIDVSWYQITRSVEKEKTKASDGIITHIINKTANTYDSYHFASQIMKAITDALIPSKANNSELWSKCGSNLKKKHQMIDLFRLQLLQSFGHYVVSVDSLYHMVKTCFMDPKCSFKLARNRRQQTEIGKAIYDSFIYRVRIVFSRDNMRNVSTKDYVLLHPIYNFFRYFENVKGIINRNLVWNNRQKYDAVFITDISWKPLQIQDTLELDLNIGSLDQCRRQYPLEHLVFRLCSINKTNESIALFRTCLKTISQKNKTLKIYDAIFAQASCVARIFNVLCDDFNLWNELIASIQLQVICTEKNILNAFQSSLRKEIEKMKRNHMHLKRLNGLIMNFPQIFDIANIRCALIKNYALIECQNTKELEQNIIIIITMVLRGDFIKNVDAWKVVHDELIIWMRSLLVTYASRDTALAMFGVAFLTKDERKMQIFKTAFDRSLTTKNTVFGRLAMYLDCASFYKLNDIHPHFINALLRNDEDPKIAEWSETQRNMTQTLCTKYTKDTKIMDTAIALWNGIFDELIVLPHALNAAQPFIPARTVSFLEPDEKTDDHEDDDGDNAMHPEFIQELEFCITMHKWIQFAADMKHIEALAELIVFTENVLHNLSECVSSRVINIECLSLLHKSQNIVQDIIKICGVQKDVKQKEITQEMAQLLNWKHLKSLFIVFLTKFTRANEDEIYTETHEFVQFIKNWEAVSYKAVENRHEWNQWLEPNRNTFQFMHNITESKVFMNIWIAARQSIADKKWNLNDYLASLYPKAKKMWDALVDRAHNGKLTLDDKKWFKGSNAEEELKTMKVSQEEIAKIKKDIECALKLDEYVQFAQSLADIVVIFKEKGHTEIMCEVKEDENWGKLLEDLKVSTAKKDDIDLSIAEAASLFRAMRAAVNKKYDNLHQHWIQIVVKCQDSVHKMANDPEFHDENISDTIGILDDAVIGSNSAELVQLSGSLRSVHTQFRKIWIKQYATYTELMRSFASLPLKQNDINNLLEVHQALPKIQSILNEASQMAKERDIQRLEEAMQNGYFIFANQSKILQEIEDNANEINLHVIAENSLFLDKYSCADIQSMIDIILLSRRNKSRYHVNEEEEEKKMESEVDEKQNNVQEYIKKIEICKKVSGLRIKHITNGGRMTYNNEKLKASSDLKEVYHKHKEWEHRVKTWMEYIDDMRNHSEIFNYFTINQVRLIVNKLNKYITKKSDLIFQELLAQFRFIEPELDPTVFKEIIIGWKKVNAEDNIALNQFNEYFNTERIMTKYENNVNDIRTTYAITTGRPNLLITRERKYALLTLLKLYYCKNNVSLTPHQILICDKATTAEQVEIFIHRCLNNQKRYQYIDASSIPLYTLLFPEDLNVSVLDAIIDEFNQYLLGRNQKTNLYAMAVISCNDQNSLSLILEQYRTSLNSELNAKEAQNICDTLFNGNDADIHNLRSSKVFVQLFKSSYVGAGKSFKIIKIATEVNGTQHNLIRIPINSAQLDLDCIVDRLYTYYYDDKKRAHIIYHIDISSSASETVNYLLFQLLFLKFIKTPNNRCFSLTNDMIVLIELPTDIATTKKKKHEFHIHTVEDEFYLLHKPLTFTTKEINHNTNPFEYNGSCHYAACFLQSFYSDRLKKEDPDPFGEKMDIEEMDTMIRQRFPKLSRTPLHYTAFWHYLFTQFRQVIAAELIKNVYYADDDQHFKHWKHLVTDSIIDLAEDFSQKLYEKSDQKMDIDDESTGSEHFHLCAKWAADPEPIVLFNQSGDGSISFLVADLDAMNAKLKKSAEFQRFKLLGWKQQTAANNYEDKVEKIRLLTRILGSMDELIMLQLLTEKPHSDYALTYDNMLKMIAISFRVKANIPVILMGETGCGKTCLVRYLAKAANMEIIQVDIHGGFTAKHIRERMHEWIKTANKTESDLWIFLDEINTSPDIGYFKEILCDKSFEGTQLPNNMKVIAACNPYRKRSVNHLSKRSVLADPLSRYMYRVYPLPSTMKEYIWMFGSLSENDERSYALQMTQTFTEKILTDTKKQEQLAQCISVSQNFIRTSLKDSAFVSLRDIARCLKIFVFLYERSQRDREQFNECMIEALALVYYFRLEDKQRLLYNKYISKRIQGFYSTLEGKDGIIDALCNEFKPFIPRGIALNRALKENLFLLFICIQTKTPLILVGKPGSSKTLAMSIIRDYLSDRNADKLKEKRLLPIHVISFQCSTQSKAEGIRKRWQQTEDLSNKNKDLIHVLLLDEVGLAEHSEFRPLKVLHQLLEIDPPPIAFIGLSNWPLDAAKMNRVITHLCPKHDIADLRLTAKAMALQYTNDNHEVETLESKLTCLSDVYYEMMLHKNYVQPRTDFFGARDFYSVVRHFLTSLDQVNKNMDELEELIMYFLRNFGGINYDRIDGSFNKKQNHKGTSLFHIMIKHMALNDDKREQLKQVIRKYSPSKLVELNLNDRRSTHNIQNVLSSDNYIISRHVMVITEYANSWNVLMDLDVINHECVFIFGSEFERDSSNMYLYLNRVQNCMETGQTLILIHLEDIHESLYDMLNQRYSFVKHSGKMYCRIALGSNSQPCFVDPAFKCIVIANKKDAHQNIDRDNPIFTKSHKDDSGTPIAFLNRFEKQLVSYNSSLSPNCRQIQHKLHAKICEMYYLDNIKQFANIFPCFTVDTIASIVLNVVRENIVSDRHSMVEDNKSENDDMDISDNDDMEDIEMLEQHRGVSDDDIIQKCSEIILDITLTEALIESTLSHRNDGKQCLVKHIPTLQEIVHKNLKMTNKLLIILSFDFASKLYENSEDIMQRITIKKMADFSKSDEFEEYIYKYLQNRDGANQLLLQHRHKTEGMNHFIHIKYLIERALSVTQNKYNKKIMILVHLRRSDQLQENFPLIISAGSNAVFLDSLSQKEPMDLESFVSQTITQMCEKRGIHLLQKTFQRALSHLVFSNEMDIDHEVRMLNRILSPNNRQDPLQKCIFNRFIRLLSSDKINRNIADIVVQSIRKTKDEQWNRGSFYELLYDIMDKIAIVAMIRILQTIYDSDSIHIVEHNQNNKDIVKLFTCLYSKFDFIEDQAIKDDIDVIITKRPNKLYVNQQYSAKFPFSNKIYEYCNSLKSQIQRREGEIAAITDEKEEEEEGIEMEVDDEKDIIEEGVNSSDVAQNTRMDAQNLKQEMQLTIAPLITDVTIEMLALYAQDIIQLNAAKLRIDTDSVSVELIELSAKYLMLITAVVHSNREPGDEIHNPVDGDDAKVDDEDDGVSMDHYNISIASLQATIWNYVPLLLHLIKATQLLNQQMINDLRNMEQFDDDVFVNTINTLFQFIADSHNDNLLEEYNLYSISEAMDFIMQSMEEMDRFDVSEMYAPRNIVKVKKIALSNGLVNIADNINTLYEVMDGVKDSNMLDYNIIAAIIQSLIECSSAQKDADKYLELKVNKLVFDVLKWIQEQYDFDAYEDDKLLNYTEFLVDLLCRKDKIITDKNASAIKWNENTEYLIVTQLFKIISKESIQSNEIREKIQKENNKLAGVILQCISKQEEELKPKVTQYVASEAQFNTKLEIHAPLIKQLNPVLYTKATESVSLEAFFNVLNENKQKYPILTQLKQQPASFWSLYKLSDIINWLQLIHNKYNGILTEETASKLMINDVLNHCKLNKWGDEHEWKQKYEQFKETMNIFCDNKLTDANHKIPIASCLISQSSQNKIIQSNVKNIQNIIATNNRFIANHTIEIKNYDLWHLRSDHLMNTQNVLQIIKQNIKPWICYDSNSELQSETYILFDFERIEREIFNKCILGRKRLNVKYEDFGFVGSKNMLKLIQSLNIKLEILNYETWHLFDKQFESNLQRKKALDIIEDIVALLASSKKNQKQKSDDDAHHNLLFSPDYDDDEDDEKGNKYDNINDIAYDQEQEIWKFMRNRLKMDNDKCNLFKIQHLNEKIQLKHIQSLWKELIQRIDGEMSQYEDQCYICLDKIVALTPIKLECCGLWLHAKCLEEYIDSKFRDNGQRITLKQLSCLMCKKPMKHKTAHRLFKKINILYDKVKQIALNRLKLEEKENVDEITSEHSEFYNNPIGFAMKIYAIYTCFKCKNPYFGGTHVCEANNENNIDPKERLCAPCAPIQDYATECEQHGSEYIQWKCKYCCALSTFCCWGTTHFCEACHEKGIINELYNNHKDKHYANIPSQPKELAKECPLGIMHGKHKPHGEEYCLGCAMCRK